MHFNVANRKVHHWGSFFAAVPLLVIIASGLLLQLKKQWTWVQPAEHRGSGTVPQVTFDQLMTSIQSVHSLQVAGWQDVDRVDVRPGRGVAKVTLKSGWEVQVDLGTGAVLQTAYRRSDLIESIHDGSFFAGDWTKLGIFLPAGVVLLVLWLSGIWMVWVQFIGKRRRKLLSRSKAAVFVFLAAGMTSMGASQRPPLAVDPLVGYWSSRVEAGETVIVADARRWNTERATTPFPVAAVKGIDDFRSGVLSVKFRLVAGESDQIAGLAFGLAPDGTYYYARYNTKDGNVALWRFVNGDRQRVVDGSDHLQLALNQWHELRVEISGPRVIATVNGKLRIEHTLAAPVSGRVGFWTKRDSVTEFKEFTATPAH